MAKSASTAAPEDTLAAVKDDLADAAASAQSWIEDELDIVRESARNEPIKMLLIAAAAGAVIGRFFL